MFEPGMFESGMFESVLVANRGEIARRVFRTCRELGIRTVAIYTALDADAPHVRDADEAVEVASYLDADAVVAAAAEAGAEAVHPGYGFLSERAEFARAVAKAGLTWVGPTPEVIEQMGRKDAAREIAVAAGVPVVPRGEDSPYPLLVKAAAGGGGKGMRIVRSPEELDEARAAAAREALSSFGDETLLIEKYVERGRHIEVQVFGDTHGNVIHLFERDCSVQRRHQKVIEEAPAPTLTDEQRNLVLTSAVALARQVDYTGAGTVEFLLDEASGEAYFLEMNTRLQVEHPVTEEAVRIDGAAADLVALQFRVAAGEPLGIAQDDVRIDGHAIEVRVYAEDAFEGFLPQAGRTSIVRWPERARVEHALESEQVVSTAYDPMLAKIIVRGADREEARTAMVKALDATAVLGLTTNTGFLRVLAGSDAFRDAEIDTAWLDRNEVPTPDPEVPRALVAWVSAMLSAISDTTTPFRADGWRLAGSPAPTIVDLDRSVTVDRPSGRVDDHLVRQISAADHVLVAIVDGVRHWAAINVQPGLAEIVHQGHRFDFSPPDRVAGAAAHHSDGAVEAKMPGTVIDVRVQVGDQVEEGQVLGVMEAMKMEVSLKAPFAGTITVVGASAGSQVPLGSELFVVEA